eukprot:COSAG01_NODE_68476_length_264_cov_0.612121_2_plen_33_part_01
MRIQTDSDVQPCFHLLALIVLTLGTNIQVFVGV